MQRRYIDRGTIYDWKAWRYFHLGTIAPGVYNGFDLSVGTAGGIQVGNTHTTDDPGFLMLPTGVGLSEDASFGIEFTLPGGPEDYTIVCRHDDNGLVGGVAATYYVTNEVLTEQPDDGCILGWIYYDGSGSLSNSMIIAAPPMRADYIGKAPTKGLPTSFRPPMPVMSLASGASADEGVDTSTDPPDVWRGVHNPSTAATLESLGYLTWASYSEPDNIIVRSYIDAGASLKLELLDTEGTVIKSQTVGSSSVFGDVTIAVPRGTGVWTEGGQGTIKLTYQNPQNTRIRIAHVTVDNWLYPFNRLST